MEYMIRALAAGVSWNAVVRGVKYHVSKGNRYMHRDPLWEVSAYTYQRWEFLGFVVPCPGIYHGNVGRTRRIYVAASG